MGFGCFPFSARGRQIGPIPCAFAGRELFIIKVSFVLTDTQTDTHRHARTHRHTVSSLLTQQQTADATAVMINRIACAHVVDYDTVGHKQ